MLVRIDKARRYNASRSVYDLIVHTQALEVGGIRPADRFEAELEDPKLGRSLRLAYDVRPLPVIV